MQVAPPQQQQQQASCIVSHDSRMLLQQLLQPWAALQVQQLLLSSTLEAVGACMFGLLGIVSTVSSLDATVGAAAFRSFLQPVLLQMLPHVQGMISRFGSGNAAGDSSSSSSSAASSSADDLRPISMLERGMPQLMMVLVEAGETRLVAD
jgi:hypothetical protein